MDSSKTVHVITSTATLLSGSLQECQTPEDDETCAGGVASTLAFSRRYASQGASLMVQFLDKSSPFVNMHPLQWVVNRLVFQTMGLDFLVDAPSILNVAENNHGRDMSGLQTSTLPLILSNVAVPPTHSWFPFWKTIQFDHDTGLAMIVILDSNVPYSIPQGEAVIAALDHIALVNQRNHCVKPNDAEINSPPSYEAYQDQLLFNRTFTSANINPFLDSPIATETDDPSSSSSEPCWVPIIIYSDLEAAYESCLGDLLEYDSPFPSIVMVTMDTTYESFPVPQRYSPTSSVWVGACGVTSRDYCQYDIQLWTAASTTTTTSENNRIIPQVTNIEVLDMDLQVFPDETMKDDLWATHISQLAVLSQDALVNDPIVGYTGAIPVMTQGSYHACKAGECAVGNLFCDALRANANADIAFTSSGGYRGLGKEAGATRFGDIYAALPFPNLNCEGTMSGLSLFRLLNYSTSVATFEGSDTENGGRLLQVAGMKVTYNTQLSQNRLVAVDVWDKTTQSFAPLDRAKLYTFATDDYVCTIYDLYPKLVGSDLRMTGEVPGQVGVLLQQNIVADYLTSLGEQEYDTSTQGRLVNNTEVTTALDFAQTEASCTNSNNNMIWSEQFMACIECPDYANVKFSDTKLEFLARHGRDELMSGRVLLLNREPFNVTARVASVPSWIDLCSPVVAANGEKQVDLLSRPVMIQPGESLLLDFEVKNSAVTVGTDRTAVGSVTFNVEDGGTYPGCSGPINPFFDVVLRETPPEDQHQLGNMRYIGFMMVIVVYAASAIYVGWVYRSRASRVINVMQPIFLLTVCFGIIILSSSMISMSLDDEIISVRGCHVACMATPWLLSIGFAISFAALYAKLLRINRLFSGSNNFRRVVVHVKDVTWPLTILLTLNVIVLLAWTFVDPLRWTRQSVDNQDWNTVGTCSGGAFSSIMKVLASILNFGALVLASIEAFKARKVSDEFSESKHIGIAVYSWLQMNLVSVPVLFLIDTDNPIARYFLAIALVFVMCLSMLVLISLPAFMNTINQAMKSMRNLRISGIQMPTSQPQASIGRELEKAMSDSSNDPTGSVALREDSSSREMADTEAALKSNVSSPQPLDD